MRRSVKISIGFVNFFFLFSEHTVITDVEKLNKELMEQDCAFWDALESSKWLPCETLEVA